MREQKPIYHYESESGWVILLFAMTCCLYISGIVVFVLVLSSA